MNKNRGVFFWFLFGLGSNLQIAASLSISELIVFLLFPFFVFEEWRYMKHSGVHILFILSCLVVIACVVSCFINHTTLMYALRGMASTTLLPCGIVLFHRIFRKDMNSFKWLLLGIAISTVLCTFIFQKSVEVTQWAYGERGSNAVDAIVRSPLYWIQRLNEVLLSPCRGWYLQCPIVYSIIVPLFMSGFALFTSSSGRAASICALVSVLFVIIGRKRINTMKQIGRHFYLFSILGVLIVFVYKGIYSYAATHGMLTQAAITKYEQQTSRGSGIIKMIMGGRMDSFCGLIACIDRPLIGFGPWARDDHGYVGKYLEKFGTNEDYELYQRQLIYASRYGLDRGLIPGHSHITMFWLWYGISGLIFWLYALYVLLRYIRQDCWAVPQWFMWLAGGVPSLVWGILFSPFSDRIGTTMIVVACLMTRAVRLGKQRLPRNMVYEIQRYCL